MHAYCFKPFIAKNHSLFVTVFHYCDKVLIHIFRNFLPLLVCTLWSRRRNLDACVLFSTLNSKKIIIVTKFLFIFLETFYLLTSLMRCTQRVSKEQFYYLSGGVLLACCWISLRIDLTEEDENIWNTKHFHFSNDCKHSLHDIDKGSQAHGFNHSSQML